MIRIVAQVKIDGRGFEKWQFEFHISDEASPEEMAVVVHGRAARIAKKLRDSGTWVGEGEIKVWYAQLNNLGIITKECAWSSLEEMA